MDRANESQNYVDKDGEKLNGYQVFTYSDGSKYEGDWKDGIRAGNGLMVFQNGAKFEGEWLDDKINGKGIYTHLTGVKYEGEWKDGNRNGIGTMIYSDGNKYEGEWYDDKREGKGIITYVDGAKYEGEWKDGNINGIGTLIYSGGNKYVGELKVGNRNGYGIFTFSDGTKYEGEWEDGNRNGYGVFTFSDGAKYEGDWKDNKKNGKGIIIYVDGTKYEGEWKDDKRHGHGLQLLTTGERYDGEWKDGNRNGLGVFTWPDGEIYEGEWKDNEKNGHGNITLPNGTKYEGEWKDDQPNGKGISTTLDGESYEGDWKDNERNGFGIGIMPNGDKYEGEWKNGNFNGQGARTYIDGTIYEGEWKDGNLSGYGRFVSLYGDKFEGEWKAGKRNGQGKYIWPDGSRFDGRWKEDKLSGQFLCNWPDGSRFEGEYKDDKRNGKGVYIWSDGSRYEDEFLNDERTGRAVYTDSFGNEQKQFCEDGQQTDSSLLMKIRAANPCIYSVKKKLETILFWVNPLQNSDFCTVQINEISFVNLTDIIEYTFNNLLSQAGNIIIRMKIPDLHRNGSLNKFSNMIREFIKKDNIEFIAQCINFNSDNNTPIKEIQTILIGITKQKKNELLKKVRFISMPDRLEKMPQGANFDRWDYFGVPFSREECLTQELITDISIDKIDIIYPWAYMPLNNLRLKEPGIEIGKFMELSTDSFKGKVEHGIDFEKYLFSDKNQFDPYSKYVISSEEKFSNRRTPFYFRRIVTGSAILFSNLSYKYFPPNSLEPLLIIEPQKPIFINKPTYKELETLIAIQVKADLQSKVDIEYIYLETRKPEFSRQFYTYILDPNYHITLNSSTILKAKIRGLPPIKVQREIVQKEKEEFFKDLKERLRYNEKAFGINKWDISHSIGSPLRYIKALTGYLYEYFDSENSQIPIDTIIKESAYIYSIRKALDRIYDEAIKGENWINGIGLDINKPLEKSNINSLIIYQLEKCSHEFYKFLVRNNVSGLENTFVDVNDNFDYIFGNLLSNANRHAFKERSEKNIVEFSSSIVSLNNRNYLNISISNNGVPMDVSLKDYISYGIKGKTSGNSGIGGSNIYDIVKSYQGFLGLKKGYAGFSVTFDILLPIADEYLPNKIISDYEPDEIE